MASHPRLLSRMGLNSLKAQLLKLEVVNPHLIVKEPRLLSRMGLNSLKAQLLKLEVVNPHLIVKEPRLLSRMGCLIIISESCYAQSQMSSVVWNVYLDIPPFAEAKVPWITFILYSYIVQFLLQYTSLSLNRSNLDFLL